MDEIGVDFLNEARFIIEDKGKLEKLKILANNYFLKCAESFDIKEAILILNENLNITDSNKLFNSWFKIDKNYLIGKNIYEIFSDESKDAIKIFFKELKKNKKYTGKNFLIKINNIKENVDINGEIFKFKNEQFIYLSFIKRLIETNIYKLKKIEEEIVNLIVRVKDFDTLMKETLRIFVHSDLFDIAWMVKVDNELKKVIPIISINENNEDDEFKNNIFKFDYFKNIISIIENKKEIITSDIEFQDTKYKKAVVFPIFNKWQYQKEDEIEYVILVHSKKDFKCGDEEYALFKEIIHKINVAVAEIFIKEQTELLLSTDILTGLPKRNIFIKKIETYIKDDIPFAIVILDINKLKKVNSVLGFWAGDQAIKKITDYLKDNLKKNFISRIGGDEFGIIIKGDKFKIFSALDKIMEFNEKIIKVEGSEIYLSLSAGVAFYPDDGNSKNELIIKAEEALDTLKKKSGKGISFANKNLNLLPKDYLELEKELKKAIENDEYVMFYQPIIDIKENKVWGAEALLRWNSKKRGLVPPGKFIPILEESGLINEVGDVIIEKVLKDIKDLEKENIHFVVSINASGIQFLSQNLAKKLIDKINNFNIKKEKVIIEITETVLMENIDVILPQIKLLKNEGIRVEIDDFGTGYSSLAYLKQLPISALKIDRAFIKDILVDKESEQIVKAIISMAKALNIKTIAEGAETKDVVEELRKLDIDYVQGFYFAKPLPKNEFKNFLNNF